MSDDVEAGKVSLGIEFDGNDISKQLEKMSGKMGDTLSKAFESAVKGMDFKPMTASITAALKEITAFDTVVDSIKGKLSGIKIPSVSAVSPTPVEATMPRTRRAAEPFDVSKAESEMEHLTQVMNNIEAKIVIQQGKLENLRSSYEHTFNVEAKSKLQEKILNTEAALLRMTKQSENAAQKIWKLEDAIKKSGQHMEQANKPMAKNARQAKSAVSSNAALIKVIQQLVAAINQLTAITTSAHNAGAEHNQQLRSNTHIMRLGVRQMEAMRSGLGGVSKESSKTSKEMKETGKSAGKMGNQFTQAFGRIAKQVLVFSVLYKAVRGAQQFMNSSMQTNQEYVASLNAIKTNLATAFQPIFNAVMPAINSFMSWLAKATAYIAAFMSSLFGTSYKQSFAAAKGIQTAKKEMAGYGKAAKKAGKDAKGALAGFDEINALDFSSSDKDAAGGGKPGEWNMEMPDLDIDGIQDKTDTLVAGMKSAFDNVWDGIKTGWQFAVDTFGPSFSEAWGMIEPTLQAWVPMFEQVFTDIVSLGDPLKNWWSEYLIPLWQQEIVLVGKIVAGLLDSLLLAFSSFWTNAFPIWEKFITKGLLVLTEFLSGVLAILGSLFDLVKQIFDDIWQGVVDPAMELISQIVQDTLDLIFDWWDEWGGKIIDGLLLTVDKLKELWTTLWEKFLKPITKSALKFLKDIWDNHLKGLVADVLNFVGKLATAALDIFNKFVMPIVNWLVKILGPIVAEIFDGALGVINDVLVGVIDAAKNIIKALGGIVDFLAGVFTGDWKRAWNGIKDFVVGIAEAIGSIFRGAINGIIEAINWMLRQVNKISIDIPDWVPGVGGKNLGFSIPEIPKLAKGGLAYGPTLAMVGDNRGASADPEVIAPLSKLMDMLDVGGSGMNEEVIAVLQAILQVLQRTQDRPVILEANGTQLAKVTTESNNDVTRRSARSMATI